MRDWKAIAKASGSTLSGKDLERLTQPLEALAETFERLAKDLPPDLEPCLEFRVEAASE
jgi:hypothetical protein